MATCVLLLGCGGGAGSRANDSAAGSVIQYHNHASRDGLYVMANLTKTVAATLHIDMSFTAKVQGPTYAQPLYVAHGPRGKATFIVATEQNIVYAFEADGGATLWETPPLGVPVPLSDLPCGDIDPSGITGTPYVDLGARNIYLDAMTTPDGGTTKKHLIFALSLDDGSVRTGWPVDVSAQVTFDGLSFDSAVQNERGALALVRGVLYVPYGGFSGDCGAYHGWVVGVQVSKPSIVKSWATPAAKGGIWGPSGVSSDGTGLFVSTGNTDNATAWSGGEAVLRFAQGPAFSGNAADYFAPANWAYLDNHDLDLGGSGALLVDVPGAAPSKLAVALGKDGYAYLLDRGNLGGIGAEVAEAHVATSGMIGAPAAYPVPGGAMVAARVQTNGHGVDCPGGEIGNLIGILISATNPPTIKLAWCSDQIDLGSPMATTTDGRANPIVWADDGTRLHGFDGATGQAVFNGTGTANLMSLVQYFQPPIVAGNRIAIAAQDQLYVFSP
jgi:hypothetical protein